MNNWKNAVKLFDDHEKTKAHRSCTIALQNRELAKVSILNKIVVSHSIEVRRNRDNLAIIIDIVVHLAKLGAPFRGHREDECSNNKGLILSICWLKLILIQLIGYYSIKDTSSLNVNYYLNMFPHSTSFSRTPPSRTLTIRYKMS